jgi:uncharacterized membrane protein HdeD (DUF308 family)
MSSSISEQARREAARPLSTESWRMVALRGALALVFGIIAIVYPGVTLLSLVLLFAVFALLDGGFGIAEAVQRMRRHERWGLPLLNGLVGIAVGTVAVLWPGLTAIAFVVLVAAWALLIGVLLLMAAWRTKRSEGGDWLLLAGTLSIGAAALLLAASVAGVVVLVWWIGAYALFLSGFLLVYAFKLRARARRHVFDGRPAPSVS